MHVHRPQFAVDDRGISLPSTARDSALEVRFDDRRVWSARAVDATGRLEWPEALLRHTRGSVVVELYTAGSAAPLWSGTIRFTDDASAGFFDVDGRALVVSKWGRAVHAVDGDEQFAARLMKSLRCLLHDLEGLDIDPFVTGGTALGAVRIGAFLPHDDDADVGYLSGAEHPADVALESLRIARALRALGYQVREHSRSHLQALFYRDETSEPSTFDHYIDLFPGFYRGERYCQPIAVRTPAAGLAITPLTSIELNGESVPSVADPEEWLARCYGPSWRTPDPAFRFETPAPTRRRFENWFGVFNTNREFWEEAHVDEPLQVDTSLMKLLEQRWERGRAVVDLGSGLGGHAADLARREHSVVGVDFSVPGLARSREREAQPSEISWVNCNFADLRDLGGLTVDLAASRRDWCVLLAHVLDGIVPETRRQVLRSVRALIACGGEAVATVYVTLPDDYRHDDPRTWHYELEAFEREAKLAGLRSEVLAVAERDQHSEWHSAGTIRSEATVVLTAAERVCTQ